MGRKRFVIDDTVWEKIAGLLPGKKADRGVTAKDSRLFLEAVLWRVRAGLPWRDLLADFGNWNNVSSVSAAGCGRRFSTASSRFYPANRISSMP